MHFLVRYYEKYNTTGSVIYFDPSAGFAIENDKVLPRNLSFNVILRVRYFCAVNCGARDATGQPEVHYGNAPASWFLVKSRRLGNGPKFPLVTSCFRNCITNSMYYV